jgi:hypothetical protein
MISPSSKRVDAMREREREREREIRFVALDRRRRKARGDFGFVL